MSSTSRKKPPLHAPSLFGNPLLRWLHPGLVAARVGLPKSLQVPQSSRLKPRNLGVSPLPSNQPTAHNLVRAHLHPLCPLRSHYSPLSQDVFYSRYIVPITPTIHQPIHQFSLLSRPQTIKPYTSKKLTSYISFSPSSPSFRLSGLLSLLLGHQVYLRAQQLPPDPDSAHPKDRQPASNIR